MSAPQIPAEILRAVTGGLTVLTASQRPARALRHAYNLHMQARGETLWTAPAVFALDTWLTSLYNRLLVTGDQQALLLNPTQELSLWRAIVTGDSAAANLRSPDALASMARDAWHTLCLYSGRHRLQAHAASQDALAFQRWSSHFQRLCVRNQYLSSAELPATLQSALARGTLPLPAPGLALVDFDILRPAHRSLFDSIERAGYPVKRVATTLPTSSAPLHAAPEEASELRAAALWARGLLTNQPSTRIAIVVPSLTSLRPRFERVLAEILASASNPITVTTPPPYEFSLGTPLSQTALASTALDLLHWALEPLPLDRITSLLLSPYFGAANPADALNVAAFDARELRGRTILRPQLTLAQVTSRASGYHRASLGALPMRLRRMQRAAAELANPHLRSCSQWAASFSALLDSAGRSSATAPDSQAFQLHRRWQSALDELATLDFDGASVPAAGALDALARILRSAIFAPESRNAPVQVLGPLELGGVAFDALWFLSADDSSWPPPTAATPLIPPHLQRELQLPGSEAGADWDAATLLTRRIAGSAPQVVFSYAAESESGKRRPSPLLRELSLAVLTELPVITPAPSRTVELFVDDRPIPPPAPGTLRGGATILELQAACPFRAFAEKRLFSTEPESREPGLDPRERGNVVHETLQLFWSQVQSHAALRGLTPETRHAILDDCIEQALRKPAASAASSWDSVYLHVERRRLRALLRPWLDEELKRPPFTVSASEHQLMGMHVGPLQLDLRVDRIDLIGDPADEKNANRTAIIDYKTGTAKTSQWLSDRPEKPQLPLYAAVSSVPPAGIAFAVLKPGKDRRLEAVAADRSIFRSGAVDDFAAQIGQWRDTLTSLAEAFYHADVRVDPRTYPQTCEHCGQRTLCRLNLVTVDDLSDEDDIFPEGEASSE